MIEVNNLTKKYGINRGITDISFTVNRGEIVGFLGPNGAGKSTTMKILTGYFAPNQGSAVINGINVIEDPFSVKKLTGYLPENNPLYKDMGVIEYLRYIGQLRQIPKGRLNSSLAKAIESCGLKDVLHKDIYELSKGYKQRIGLAQALLHEPDILILDEPTTGLDPNQIIEIRNLIKTLGAEKTILLSTHILPEVSATCNRIIIINKGRIIASGTPDELSRTTDSGTTIEMRFKGDLRGFIKQLSKKYRDSISFDISDDDRPDWKKITLQLSENNINTEDIFAIVAKNNWMLSELKSQDITLENIFTNLTTQEPPISAEDTNPNDGAAHEHSVGNL